MTLGQVLVAREHHVQVAVGVARAAEAVHPHDHVGPEAVDHGLHPDGKVGVTGGDRPPPDRHRHPERRTGAGNSSDGNCSSIKKGPSRWPADGSPSRPILAGSTGALEPRDLSPTAARTLRRCPVPRPAVPIDSAADFTRELMARATEAQRVAYRRYFPADDSFAGVRMGEVFELAKRALALTVADIEVLLDNLVDEVRAGACSVMGKAASHRRDRRAAAGAVRAVRARLRPHRRLGSRGPRRRGGPRHLADRQAPDATPRAGRLAALGPSGAAPSSRTAASIRRGETVETFEIGRAPRRGRPRPVQKGVRWMLRYAGDVDRLASVVFDTHVPAMPRPMLRAATEKFDRGARSDLLSARR